MNIAIIFDEDTLVLVYEKIVLNWQYSDTS